MFGDSSATAYSLHSQHHFFLSFALRAAAAQLEEAVELFMFAARPRQALRILNQRLSDLVEPSAADPSRGGVGGGLRAVGGVVGGGWGGWWMAGGGGWRAVGERWRVGGRRWAVVGVCGRWVGWVVEGWGPKVVCQCGLLAAACAARTVGSPAWWTVFARRSVVELSLAAHAISQMSTLPSALLFWPPTHSSPCHRRRRGAGDCHQPGQCGGGCLGGQPEP